MKSTFLRKGEVMRIVSFSENEVTITVAFDDLDFLRQGMREMLDALNDREIKMRTGKTSENAKALMRGIRDILEAADKRS